MAQKRKSGNTVAAVAKLCEPFAQQLGLTIWDIRYVKEGSYWYLRIFIDKPEGVTLDDCEAMSRAINDPLDQLDPIDGEYCLEVCSPGIDRELVRPEHFEAFLGAVVNASNNSLLIFLKFLLKIFIINIYIIVTNSDRRSIFFINV